jgi:hypothetical protein
MSLVEVIEQFQAVSDEQRIKLETIYSDLKENEADSIAGTILQQIDRGEVETKKDLPELMESLKAYKTKEVDSFLDISYEYDFRPPGDEFPLEYSDTTLKQRLLTLGEDGVWMEIEEDGTKIGPVDRDHNPTEGHPEYLTVDLSEATMAETTVQLPKPIFADTADVLSSLEKALVPPAFIPATQPGPLTTSQSQPELQEVFLETEMGDLLFEPEEAFLANRSFVMVFNTNRSKPPLYPRVGSKFRLKYNRENYPVSYMDTSFSYKNRKFVVFIILDEEY